MAVKVAFGLNKHEGVIDISDLTSLPVIQEISNQQLGEDSYLFFTPADAIARIRQSSIDIIRHEVHKKLIVLDKQIKCAELFKKYDLEAEMNEKAIALFARELADDSYEALLSELKSVCLDNIHLIGKMMTEKI